MYKCIFQYDFKGIQKITPHTIESKVSGRMDYVLSMYRIFHAMFLKWISVLTGNSRLLMAMDGGRAHKYIHTLKAIFAFSARLHFFSLSLSVICCYFTLIGCVQCGHISVSIKRTLMFPPPSLCHIFCYDLFVVIVVVVDYDGLYHLKWNSIEFIYYSESFNSYS